LADQPAGSFSPSRTGAATLDNLMARYGVQGAAPLFNAARGDHALKQRLGLLRTYVLSLPAAADIRAAARDFAADPQVSYAEPDFTGRGALLPNDPSFGQQWNLYNTGQEGGQPGADIDAPMAWDITTGSDAIILAVIDSGADLDHPDLVGRLVPGYDFVNNDATPQDDHGHGTHVAGIAAATANNAVGVSGVCWQCRIMPLKALNFLNWGNYSWWAAALEYAVDHGARAINMSMGGSSPSSTLYNAIRYAYEAGVPVSAAMMNDGDTSVYYPAAYAETIAVGATDRYDFRAPFSNYGSHIDLAAPGDAILSTVWNDHYAVWSGTSMAAPHVTGVIGLLYSLKPGYTLAEIRTVLNRTADDQVGSIYEDTPGWDPYFGYGRLNAYLAVSYAAGYYLESVTLGGPTLGYTNTSYTFSAEVWPGTAVTPITYGWMATGQTPVTHTGALNDAVDFAWSLTGTYQITVTASNAFTTVVATQAVALYPVNGPYQVYLPKVIK
jgi:subtilisin family serine protease